MKKYTMKDIEEAQDKGSFGLDGYVVYRCLLFTPSFFDNNKKIVTLSRVKNVRGSGYEDISYDDLFSKCEKLTTQQAKERYPSLVW